VHRLLFTLLLLFTYTICAGRGIEVTEKSNRIALVIGNANYRSSPLKNPVNDANDMAYVLKQKGFAVTLLTDANQRVMKRSIRQFGKDLAKGGVGLFFYAGHGMQVDGINYLIPVGTDIEAEDEIEFSAINANLIIKKMESAGNHLNMIFLDACRNNPFARSFRSGNKGLAQMDAPAGSLIAYATAPGSVAADGDGRNGVFTKHLLKAINQRGIELSKVMKAVGSGVQNETGKKQVPWTSTSITGDFYFQNKNTELSTSDTGSSAGLYSDNDKNEDAKDLVKKAHDMYWDENPGGGLAFKIDPKAINYLKNIVLKHPKYVDAYDHLAWAYFNNQKMEEALDILNRALNLDHRNISLLNLRGGVHLMLKDDIKALSDYERLIDLDPENTSYYFNTGQILLSLNLINQAIERYNELIKIEKGEKAGSFFLRGKAYEKKGEEDKALEDYQKCIEIDNKSTSCYFDSISILIKNEKNYSALNLINDLLKIEPDNIRASYKKAIIFYDIGKFNEAITLYTKLIKLEPDYYGGYFARGNSYSALKNYKLAIKDYDVAISLNPKHWKSYLERGTMNAYLGSSNSAINDYSYAIKLNPKISSVVYSSRGSVFYYHLRKSRLACKDWEKGCELKDDYCCKKLKKHCSEPEGQNVQINNNLKKKVPLSKFDMVLIPAGEFQMGSNNGESDEKPIHTVYLDEFMIDQYEVTVNKYKQCVLAGICEITKTDNSSAKDQTIFNKYCNYDKSDRGNHPINCVDWYDAKAYCEYVSKRLPTEAEWEKAATWKNRRKSKYPTGKDSISCQDAVMDDGRIGCGKWSTWDVGSKSKEINNTYDMTGNVYEWVEDLYDKSYYTNSPRNNPTGSSSGFSRVNRGGYWSGDAPKLHGTRRGKDNAITRGLALGFRCAVSP
jgi:formylglycine-generating enzyme required for sulfatase activity/tetratricopeptide (TPR) repeat protein